MLPSIEAERQALLAAGVPVAFAGNGYVPFGRPGSSAHFSEHFHDPAWDAFLESTRLGEYQQSSMWARVKEAEGWRVARVVVAEKGHIRGGFQILWKKTLAGRIGYVARGPVLPDPLPEAGRHMTELLRKAARQLGLRALVAQCPAEGHELDTVLAGNGFLPNRVIRIITATWVTPLSGGMAAVDARMRRETRARLRKAGNHGITVLSGGEADLDVFFELMLKTCRRQAVTPNPGSVEILRQVWKAFHQGDHVRLAFAIYDGVPVSGQLSFRFGTALYLWKKGTNSEYLRMFPMEPLYHDAFKWACESGCRHCDHGSLGRNTAECVLNARPMTAEMNRSRDCYSMRFGGHPVLLPEARIYLPNPVLRTAYRSLVCNSLCSRLLRKRYQC